jgi:ankyrin repeat protein
MDCDFYRFCWRKFDKIFDSDYGGRKLKCKLQSKAESKIGCKVCGSLAVRGAMKKNVINVYAIAAVTLAVLVSCLLVSCGKKNARSDEIYYAAANGELGKVKALLKTNPDLISSKEDKFGYTPLHLATQEGHKDVVAYLLANKADVNAREKDNQTPLHLAVVRDHKDVAELLLTNNADVNAKDKNGWTPLHWAAALDHEDMAALLLANNADVNAKSSDGTTPLHLATQENDKDIVALLLANNADVNAKDDGGTTPLHLAVFLVHEDVADLLRQHGGHE